MANIVFPTGPVGGGQGNFGNVDNNQISGNGSGMGGGANDFYQSSFVAGGALGGAGGANGMGRGNVTQQPPEAQYYMPTPSASTDADNFDDEPPLHEELGINIPAVLAKMRAVANPFSKINSSFVDDADMTGPLALFVLLGFAHMFQKKVQFGIIYAQAIVGCLAVYFIFNLMSSRGIDLYRSTSILGYSLMPIVFLSFLTPIKETRLAFLLHPFATACTLWSTTTASKIFVAVLGMQDQFWLVFYPLALLYASFVIITIF